MDISSKYSLYRAALWCIWPRCGKCSISCLLHKNISCVTSSNDKVELLSQSLECRVLAQAYSLHNLWCQSRSWLPCFMWLLCQTPFCEGKMLLPGGPNLEGTLLSLDAVYLKKYGCSDSRYSASQLSAHVTPPLVPSLSSFTLQSSKEKVGEGEAGTLFPLCLYHITYPGAVLPCSQCK